MPNSPSHCLEALSSSISCQTTACWGRNEDSQPLGLSNSQKHAPGPYCHQAALAGGPGEGTRLPGASLIALLPNAHWLQTRVHPVSFLTGKHRQNSPCPNSKSHFTKDLTNQDAQKDIWFRITEIQTYLNIEYIVIQLS